MPRTAGLSSGRKVATDCSETPRSISVGASSAMPAGCRTPSMVMTGRVRPGTRRPRAIVSPVRARMRGRTPTILQLPALFQDRPEALHRLLPPGRGQTEDLLQRIADVRDVLLDVRALLR